jgi:hypothetical protein
VRVLPPRSKFRPAAIIGAILGTIFVLPAFLLTVIGVQSETLALMAAFTVPFLIPGYLANVPFDRAGASGPIQYIVIVAVNWVFFSALFSLLALPFIRAKKVTRHLDV